MGGAAIIHDPVSRGKHEALRAKGHGYCRSIRGVADRLLFAVCAVPEKEELFDREFKKTPRDAA